MGLFLAGVVVGVLSVLVVIFGGYLLMTLPDRFRGPDDPPWHDPHDKSIRPG